MKQDTRRMLGFVGGLVVAGFTVFAVATSFFVVALRG